MALELHIMTTGSTRGVPVRDLGIIGAAVAEAWPGSTMGNCEGHEQLRRRLPASRTPTLRQGDRTTTMRAIVTIYDANPTRETDLFRLCDLCMAAVGSNGATAGRNDLELQITVTVVDVPGTQDDANELTDLLRTAVSEWTSAPCDVEIEAAA